MVKVKKIKERKTKTGSTEYYSEFEDLAEGQSIKTKTNGTLTNSTDSAAIAAKEKERKEAILQEGGVNVNNGISGQQNVIQPEVASQAISQNSVLDRATGSDRTALQKIGDISGIGTERDEQGNVISRNMLTGEVLTDSEGNPIQITDTLISLSPRGAIFGFLSSAFSKGTVAKTAVLSAPVKAAASRGLLSSKAGALLAFAGLGSAQSITSNLLTSETNAIEAEVGKLGEQMTKIPETVRLGFSIDENGQIYEYPPEQALSDLDDIDQALQNAEQAMQQVSIGTVALRLRGRYNTAMNEIDKQRRELVLARAKVLQEIINPSETLQTSRQFFEGLDLNG